MYYIKNPEEEFDKEMNSSMRNILMPKSDFLYYWRDHKKKNMTVMDNIRKLSKLFKCSDKQVIIRAKELELIPWYVAYDLVSNIDTCENVDTMIIVSVIISILLFM